MSWKDVVFQPSLHNFHASLRRIWSSTTKVNQSLVKLVNVSSSTWYISCCRALIQYSANVDPDYFPNPKKVDIHRPTSKYSHYGWGPHACFGGEMVNAGLTGMLRCFARLPNLRRAPGPEGQLKYVVMGPFRVYLNSDWSNFSPWPTSLLLYEKES